MRSEVGSDPAPRICAVVVTHNRKDLLHACLRALKEQSAALHGVCLIDNASSDGTAQSLKESGYLDVLPPTSVDGTGWHRNTEIAAGDRRISFHYRRLGENLGGAGGFCAGMGCALAAGYDGLWLMDDDAKPATDALARLLAHWDRPGLGALAGAVSDCSGLQLTHRGHFDFHFDRVFPLLHEPLPAESYENETLEIDMASFVGLLIKSEAIAQAGLPRKEFFLHYDDAEYCIRLRKVGQILLVPGSRIEHRRSRQQGAPKSQWLFLSSYRPSYDELWVLYYGLRNLTWVGKTYHHSFARFYGAVANSWLRAVTSVLLFDRDYKWRRMKLLTSAYLDGLRGVFDNSKPERILYGGSNHDN
jgi:GT2 family glycosyltransferase